MCDQVCNSFAEVRRLVLIDCDHIDIGESDSRFVEAKPNRLAREARPMFHATKALLLSSCEHDAVTEEAGTRIPVECVHPHDDHCLKPAPVVVRWPHVHCCERPKR